MQEAIKRIARLCLSIRSFEMKGRDSHDFVEVTRENIEEALRAAYEAGVKDTEARYNDARGQLGIHR